MNIIIVDDEELMVASLHEKVTHVKPDANIFCFTNPEDALKAVGRNRLRVDVAFVDIRMFDISGLDLSKRLEQLNSRINVIFVTGYSEYAVNAMKLRASGYLMKPVREESIKHELDNLRYPVNEAQDDAVFMKTFGNFDMLVGGKPVAFRRSKSKEVLAYLVDLRGESTSLRTVAATLWEGKEYSRSLQSQLQTAVSELMKTLAEYSAQDIIVKRRNELAVDCTKFDCDFYRMLDGDAAALNSYCGEYMSNYSWAEFTNGRLCREYYENEKPAGVKINAGG